MRSWKKPTPEQVDKAVALLVYYEHYRGFFDRLENPEWVEPLWERGFFRQPPHPIREEERVHFPPWPEAKYLARMAKHKPELVARIILEMEDTENALSLKTSWMPLLPCLLTSPHDLWRKRKSGLKSHTSSCQKKLGN